MFPERQQVYTLSDSEWLTIMLPGSIGPYRIERLLGEGGMGAVYEGVHENTARRVAIKVLHSEYARDATMTTRFFNEARAVNKVEHPGILQVFDYGQQTDGCAYIAMELLKGETLSSRLARGPQPRPLGEALRLGWQIAAALAAAHKNGIVHRDLKPDNIMIVRDSDAPGGERTKLLDFGIAKLVEAVRGNQPKTQSQVVMGTPQYMSPEQCKGASHVDDKTDVYALGVLLFELLAGRTPFVTDSNGEYIGMHLFRQPPRLNEIAPSIPAELASLVDSMLVKDKLARPTMAQVVASLAQSVRRYGTSSFQSEQFYSLASRGDIPTMYLGANSTLGRSIGQLKRLSMARWHLAGGLLFFAIVAFTAVKLRTVGTGERHASTPPIVHPSRPLGFSEKADSVPSPSPAPAKVVRWSLRTTPSGATVVDSDGHILGRTPWQQSFPAANGAQTLYLRLAGYADQTVSLDRNASTDRYQPLRLTPSASSRSVSKSKRPPEQKVPASIDYEP